MARIREEPDDVRHQVAGGIAELLPDLDRPTAYELSVDGIPQSYVDVAEPTHLEYAYVRHLGDLLDLAAPEGEPLTVLHLGGGACTLPRYVAATRPGSTQLVVEADAALADLVRRELGTRGFRLRIGDARAELTGLGDDTSDVVLGDVFASGRLPGHVATVEHVREIARVLRPAGTYAVNMGDGGALAFSRGQAATLRAVFAHVALLSDPGVLRGRRFGNVVLAASQEPLPVGGLIRRATRAAGTARVVTGEQLDRFTGGAAVVTDATVGPTPVAPPDLFER